MAKAKKTPKKQVKSSRGAKSALTIGIDLGGTKVGAGLVDDEGKLLFETIVPTVPPWLEGQDPRVAELQPPKSTEVRRHIEYVVNAMADATAAAVEASSGKIQGVGLASAGPMNLEKGTLDYPANFRGWKIVPLVKLLQEQLRARKIKCPVYFQNDAIAAALGEGWTGRAAGLQTYAVVTVGTGIGSGVILNGRPAQSRGMGSEWGHLIVQAPGISQDSNDIYDRTVEGLASGTGLARLAIKMGLKETSAAELARAAREGNRPALELFKGASEALASLFYALSIGFHLEKIVISGGMLAIKDCYLPNATSLYRELIMTMGEGFRCPVETSKLGNKAGVIGAARLPHLLG